MAERAQWGQHGEQAPCQLQPAAPSPPGGGSAGEGGLPHWDIMTPRGLQASGATLPSDAEPLLCVTLNKHLLHV